MAPDHSTAALTPRQYRVLLLALVAFYLLTRLPGLTRLPVFIDEAAHIYWAGHELAGGMPYGRLLALGWMACFVRPLSFDPLLAARLSSVISGLGILLVLVELGRTLFTRQVALLAGGAYVVLPYALFYDRLALTDPFMALSGGLILLFSVRVVQRWRASDLLLLMLTLMLAPLAKLSGIVYVPIPIVVVITLLPSVRWRGALLRLLPLLLGVGVVFVALRVQGYGQTEFGTQAGGDLSLWGLVRLNLTLVGEWAWMLLTPPLALISGAALAWAALGSRRRADWLLLGVLGLAVVPFLVTARWLYPRYFLLGLVPLALFIGQFAAAGLSRVGRRTLARGAALGLASLLLVWPLALDVTLVRAPQDAPLPPKLRWQYVAGWPSGTGLVELADFLQDQAAYESDGITVLRFPFLGPAFLSLDVVLPSNPALYPEQLVPTDPQLVATVQSYALDRRTLLVLSPPVERNYLAALDQPLDDLLAAGTLIWEYPKPDGLASLQVWAFEPCGLPVTHVK